MPELARSGCCVIRRLAWSARGPAECWNDVAFFRIDLASTRGTYLPVVRRLTTTGCTCWTRIGGAPRRGPAVAT